MDPTISCDKLFAADAQFLSRVREREREKGGTYMQGTSRDTQTLAQFEKFCFYYYRVAGSTVLIYKTSFLARGPFVMSSVTSVVACQQ